MRQARLPYAKTRPRLNRTLAVLIISVLGNMGVTLGIAFLGAWISGLVNGVPVFPPGWQAPWVRASAA